MRGFWNWKTKGVTREDVHAAYELVLKRPPESEHAIRDHLQHTTVHDLIAALLHSDEFAKKSHSPAEVTERGWQRFAKPLAIECDHADDAILAELFSCVRQTWEAWGRSDPHFSVLTHPQFRADRFGDNEIAFYSEGAGDERMIASALARARVDPASLPVFVEFGCGVGRATWRLASMFQKIVAVDISKPHLDVARRWLDARKVRNVDLRHLAVLSDYDCDGYDFWFSRLVLQHNPPPLTLGILVMSLTRLRPGGMALFQIPTYVDGYSFSTADYLHAYTPEARIETHCVPQGAILEVVATSHCEVLEVFEDSDPGTPGAIASYTFLVRRRNQ